MSTETKICYENRFITELRAEKDGDDLTIIGYPILFDVIAEIWDDFTESIEPDSVDDKLLSDDEILLNVEHNDRNALARNNTDFLKLSKDSKGVKMTAILPDTEEGRTIYQKVKHKIYKMSFRFISEIDEWVQKDKTTHRTIKKFKVLRDVTLTTRPAYLDTTAEIKRSKFPEDQNQDDQTHQTFNKLNETEIIINENDKK